MAVVAVASTAPVELIRSIWAFPVKVDNVILAGAAKTVTTPTGVTFARIFTTETIYLKTGGAATVPAADTQDGSNDGSGSLPIRPEADPVPFNVRGIATFSIIGTAIVGIAWYRDHGAL